MKIGRIRIPKESERIPTSNFQGHLLLVSGRVVHSILIEINGWVPQIRERGNLDGNSLKPPKKPEVFGEDSLELSSNRGGLLIVAYLENNRSVWKNLINVPHSEAQRKCLEKKKKMMFSIFHSYNPPIIPFELFS